MAEPRKAKIEVVFAADGVEVVRLYGTSWSDQEPALALYGKLAPFIHQVHVRFRKELLEAGASPTPIGNQEGEPVTSPSPHAIEGETLPEHPTDNPYPYQTLNDIKAGALPIDGQGPKASPRARQ